ncbi:MAG: HDIG domain-containing protein [Deltaproteobacteria bacterium]|nr:HDIG domain-containing protein [Deltaproteobacteria bacterium]
MSARFPVRRFSSLRATAPWAAVLALALTIVGALELLLPPLQLEAGQPAPIQVRRAPRIVPPPLAERVEDRSDLDAWRGEPVNPVAHADLLARQADRLERLPGWLAGNFVLFAAALLALSWYLRRFGRGLVRYTRTHFVVFGVLFLWLALFKVFLLFTPFSPYWFPLAAPSLIFGHQLGRRAGITITLFVALCAASFLEFDVALMTAVVFQGLIVGALVEARKRRRVSRLASVGVLAGVLSALVMGAAMFAGARAELAEAYRYVVQANPLAGAVGGGILAGVLAWWFAVPAGMALGIPSRGKLIDLQDVEHPLLRHVRERAPGSWEHSRAMANLAEAAAAHIGADGLLVRVGAYYHDYGKTIHPDFFIENILSEPGKEQPNPHKDLDPKDSSDHIVEHVSGGVARLRQQKLPEAVVEFAYTHHGTSVIEFFWGKCQETGNPHGYTREDFSYPGLRPQTRETGILMIVDAVEAASRTVQPPTREKFRKVVEHIVLSKLIQGQLDDSDLSLEDLHRIIDNLVDSLVHGRHERVKYPWQKGDQTIPPQAPQAAAAPATTPEPSRPARPAEPIAPPPAATPASPTTGPKPVVTPAAPATPAPPTAAPQAPPTAVPGTTGPKPVASASDTPTKPAFPSVPPAAEPAPPPGPSVPAAPAPAPSEPAAPKPPEPPDEAGGI